MKVLWVKRPPGDQQPGARTGLGIWRLRQPANVPRVGCFWKVLNHCACSNSTGMSSCVALSKHSCCGCNLPGGFLLLLQPSQFGSRSGNNGVEGREKKLPSESKERRTAAVRRQKPWNKSKHVEAGTHGGGGGTSSSDCRVLGTQVMSSAGTDHRTMWKIVPEHCKIVPFK